MTPFAYVNRKLEDVLSGFLIIVYVFRYCFYVFLCVFHAESRGLEPQCSHPTAFEAGPAPYWFTFRGRQGTRNPRFYPPYAFQA